MGMELVEMVCTEKIFGAAIEVHGPPGVSCCERLRISVSSVVDVEF